MDDRSPWIHSLQLPSGLLSLGLSDNCIGDMGASSLAELLIQTDTLQKLFLSGNNVHDEGGSKLVAALSQNRSLKGLYLAGVSLIVLLSVVYMFVCLSVCLSD